MDDTINSQNMQQSSPQGVTPAQSSIPAQPLQPGQAAPIGQPIQGTAQQVIQQQPIYPPQPVIQPVPPRYTSPVANSTASPVPPTPPAGGSTTPRITLEDLYGPSGFAEESPSPAVPTPLSQPLRAVPVTPPVVNPPAQQDALPDLPTVPQEPENDAPKPAAPLSMETPPQATLPLRKSSFQSAEMPSASQPPQVPPGNTPPASSPEKPSQGPNKLKLFRLLFAGIGILVSLVVLLFVVQFLSSVFHPSSSSSKVTLVYWGLWEDANTMQASISEFETQHPNITIAYEKQDPKQYTQRLLTHMQQGDGPDIFRYHSSWLPLLKGDLAPIPTSVISKQDVQNSFYPVVRNDLVKNGALYGIPLEVDTLSLFVNNALLKNANVQVPTTWDAFTSDARALTVKDANGKIKIAGAALGTYDNITHAPDILSALMLQNGVNLQTITPSGNAADAITFYTSFATGESNVWDSTLDPSMLAFAKGNLAMYFGYSWDVFMIKASNPNLDFSIYPIPHLPGRNTTTASYWVEGVSAKSQHQKEALEFMHFLAQKSTEATLYTEESKTRLFGEPYAHSDLGATLKNTPLVYPFVEQATDAISSFFAGETDDATLNGQMNGYLGNAIRSVLNGTSAQSAVDTLTQGVQQVEKQYGF